MLWYVACPYTGNKSEIRERMRIFDLVDAHLIKLGYFTVSPLSKHDVVEEHEVPSDWIFWERYSRELLSKCNGIFVIQISGWEQSTGVNSEIELAKELGIPICFIKILENDKIEVIM